MNENVERWVKALRSGEYKQGAGALRSGDQFCCLGVACDLFDSSGWRPSANHFLDSYLMNGIVRVGALPEEVMHWLGLSDSSGYLVTRGGGYIQGQWVSLADANDGGATFEEIADLIEDNADKLFKQAQDS